MASVIIHDITVDHHGGSSRVRPSVRALYNSTAVRASVRASVHACVRPRCILARPSLRPSVRSCVV
jgi:hypothetical protein